MIEQPIVRPRDWLPILRARYDDGATPDGVWQVIKDLERHAAWLEHVSWARRAVAPSPQTAGKAAGRSHLPRRMK